MRKKTTYPAPRHPSEFGNSSIADAIAARTNAMKIPELASLLGMSKQTLYLMVENGSLPAIRIGTNIRLDPKTTAEWLRQRTG